MCNTQQFLTDFICFLLAILWNIYVGKMKKRVRLFCLEIKDEVFIKLIFFSSLQKHSTACGGMPQLINIISASD